MEVASALLSTGLSEAAKSAWQSLKTALRGHGDGGIDQAISRFEQNPGNEGARELCSFVSASGIDRYDNVAHALSNLGTQLAIGPGAVAAFNGTNYGTVGGIHVAPPSPRLIIHAGGRHSYSVCNRGESLTCIVRLDCDGAERLEPLVRLPVYLGPGESLDIVISPLMGAGGLQLAVYEWDSPHPTRLRVPRGR